MNNLLENQIEVENDQSSRPTTSHMQKKTSITNIASHLRVKRQIIEEKEEAEVINSEIHNRNFLLEQNKSKKIRYYLKV
ncbi:20527_t:CDS:2 [Cetraspora pellucida]|uniref:20527_t:CDS:1 n=1 Tax=Cetraspora pellucida TaxID=1433469 RepID=A0A9N9AYL7_9GLOM|nr:20527_t:CDS:2 [Cetraspora pellucida]